MASPKSVLFVCRANERRSPTAEVVFKWLLVQAGYKPASKPDSPGIYVDSAGVNTDPQKYTVKPMTKDLGDLAERIFTFNENLRAEIALGYQQDPIKIINLNVADRWQSGHPELVKELRKKLEPYVIEWYPPRH